MEPAKPPALAAWLLEHTGFSGAGGALAGDLLEQFQQRRSAVWYWRQVMMAIVTGCATEIRRHLNLAMGAAAITWAANYGVLIVSRRLMAAWVGRAIPGPAFPLVPWTICFLGGMVSGLLVASVYRRHRYAMRFTSAAALLGWALLAIMLLKKDALQHSPLQIAVVTIVYYLVALAGFSIGGWLSDTAMKLRLAGRVR